MDIETSKSCEEQPKKTQHEDSKTLQEIEMSIYSNQSQSFIPLADEITNKFDYFNVTQLKKIAKKIKLPKYTKHYKDKLIEILFEQYINNDLNRSIIDN